MGPTRGPPGSCRPQVGPTLAPWTLLSGLLFTGWSSRGNNTLSYVPRCAVEITVITLLEHAGTVPNTLKLNAVSSGAHPEPTAVKRHKYLQRRKRVSRRLKSPAILLYVQLIVPTNNSQQNIKDPHYSPFVRGIYLWPVPHKGPAMGKLFPYYDVIILHS